MLGLEPLTPAYGKDYKSLKAVQKDFDDDKDFMTASGQYVNKSDLYVNKSDLKDKKQIRVRYSKQLKTGFLKIK